MEPITKTKTVSVAKGCPTCGVGKLVPMKLQVRTTADGVFLKAYECSKCGFVTLSTK